MNILLRFNLLLLMVVVIFDPSDLLLHAKVPVFAGVWVIFLADMLVSKGGRHPIPPKLCSYLCIFVVLLPLMGLLIYLVRDGGMEDYDGFQYYKSYLFLTLCIPLVAKRIDLMRPLSYMLSTISIATIVLCVITKNDESLRTALGIFGDTFVIFTTVDRSYGSLAYQTFYFHSSPLLVLAIVYFCSQYLHSKGWSRLWNAAFLLLNVSGMVLSGTRNNVIVGVAAPLLVWAWYRGTRARLVIVGMLIAAGIVGLSFDVIQSMLSTDDVGNAIKLGHVHDYGLLFSDWRTLLFGQGFGARFFSTAWGMRVSLTELTYLEIIRNYGIILAPVFFGLVLLPLKALRESRLRAEHYVFCGYACYLYLCTGNPLLLSSTGMLVLAIVLFKRFSVPPSDIGSYAANQSGIKLLGATGSEAIA